jgi:hypothetical protein
MEAAKAKKVLEKQYARQNKYIKEKFDRVSVTLPKGTKERITATGESVNGFINRLVAEALEGIPAPDLSQKNE